MLSVVILTKNEASNIVAAINNAKLVTSSVLVIDSGSEDDTVELAKKAGAKVIYRAWDDDFAAQRNFALEYLHTEWVLYLDADERMNNELISSIKSAISKGTAALYEMERRNSAFGRDFKYGVLSADSVKRLFPVKQGTWQGKVHESVKTELPTVKLNGYIQHYTYKDFDQYVYKMNMYSTIWAKDSKKEASWFKDILLRPIFAFFKMYILELGFLEGWLGFILAANYGLYTLNKYAKLKIK